MNPDQYIIINLLVNNHFKFECSRMNHTRTDEQITITFRNRVQSKISFSRLLFIILPINVAIDTSKNGGKITLI